ncbi:MAG: cytochrome P450 [bacterium]|nr:cytochrome P450 [bacterium]
MKVDDTTRPEPPPVNAPASGSQAAPRLGLREGLRALKAFAADPLAALTTLAQRGESLQRLRGIDLSLLILHDPELIGDALMSKGDAFIKDRFTHDLDILLGQGLLTSEGDLWKRQRRMIAPSLSPKHIAGYADCMARRTADFARELPERGTSDVHEALMQLTLDIVVETLFGAEIDERDGQVGGLLEHLMEDYVLLVRTWRRLLPRWFPQPVRRRIQKVSAAIDAIIERVVREKQAGALDGDDLLTRLLIAQKESEAAGDGADANARKTADARQMRDELVTLFTAGHETTALTMAYTLHLIAGRPEVQDRLHAEIEAAAPGRALNSSDAMGRLPFCTAVIRESMRLYPPAWIIGREAVRDCSVGPYAVKRGEQLLIAPYTTHRNPKYFPEPDRFLPERWEGSDADSAGLYESLPRYVYLPFGGGPRICVGNHFAMMEAVLILGTLVRSKRFARTAEDPPLKFFPAVTLRPAGEILLEVSSRA